MTVFVADHTGSSSVSSTSLRPIHIGAALAERTGPEPDTTVADSLSGDDTYADLRLYDYVAKAYAGETEFVCMHQYRRAFFLGTPDRADPVLWPLRRRVAKEDEGQFSITSEQHERYLEHVAGITEAELAAELGGATFIANRWSFGDLSVADQYLRSIADLYPDDERYVDAWFALERVLHESVGDTARSALEATHGWFNNAFVTTWDEFMDYRAFLFAVLDQLEAFRGTHRLFGYLAERIMTVYLAHQLATRPGFEVRSRRMMFVG